MLTLDGRSAKSLREFAESEQIDVSMAGLIYLDQVVRRLSSHTDDIETISTTGADPVQEIFHVLEHRPVHRVIVPAGLAGLEGDGLVTLVRLCPVPVVVAGRVEGGGTGFLSRRDHSGEWQTASTLLPSGSRTKAP